MRRGRTTRERLQAENLGQTRKTPPLDETADAATDAEPGCAGGDAVVLSEEQAVQVGEVIERMSHIESTVAQAREFANPHIVMTLENARRTLLKQCVGAHQ